MPWFNLWSTLPTGPRHPCHREGSGPWGWEGALSVFSGSKEYVMSARASSTRWTYASYLCQIVPSTQLIVPSVWFWTFVALFLDTGCSPETLKVLVAALSAYQDPMEQVSIGANRLVAFLKEAVWLKPPVRLMCTQWDWKVCVQHLTNLLNRQILVLSMKTAFLLARTSAKRDGECPQCLCFRGGINDDM